MILAAAIKYKIEKTGEEVVLCGCRHGDIFQQLRALGFEPGKGYKELEQGFIDHNNKFMDRYFAFFHAHRCGQLSQKIYDEKSKLDKPQLISEDLW